VPAPNEFAVMPCCAPPRPHLDAHSTYLPSGSWRDLAVWRDQDEVQLGVIRLRHELADDAGQRDGLGLVVHRERMMA